MCFLHCYHLLEAFVFEIFWYYCSSSITVSTVLIVDLLTIMDLHTQIPMTWYRTPLTSFNIFSKNANSQDSSPLVLWARVSLGRTWWWYWRRRSEVALGLRRVLWFGISESLKPRLTCPFGCQKTNSEGKVECSKLPICGQNFPRDFSLLWSANRKLLGQNHTLAGFTYKAHLAAQSHRMLRKQS